MKLTENKFMMLWKKQGLVNKDTKRKECHLFLQPSKINVSIVSFI